MRRKPDVEEAGPWKPGSQTPEWGDGLSDQGRVGYCGWPVLSTSGLSWSVVRLGGEGTRVEAGRGGAEGAVGGLFEAVDPGVVAAGESVGEGFLEADLLFAGGRASEEHAHNGPRLRDFTVACSSMVWRPPPGLCASRNSR